MPRIKHITDIANPFDPADEGNYTTNIEESLDTVSNAGAEMLRIKHKIVGADDSANEQHIGKTLYDYVVYGGDNPSNFSLFRLRQYAVAAGANPANFDATELNGTELHVQIRVREATDEYPASNQIGRLFVDVA